MLYDTLSMFEDSSRMFSNDAEVLTVDMVAAAVDKLVRLLLVVTI